MAKWPVSARVIAYKKDFGFVLLLGHLANFSAKYFEKIFAEKFDFVVIR